MFQFAVCCLLLVALAFSSGLLVAAAPNLMAKLIASAFWRLERREQVECSRRPADRREQHAFNGPRMQLIGERFGGSRLRRLEFGFHFGFGFGFGFEFGFELELGLGLGLVG